MIKDVINATRLHCKLKIRFSEDLDFEVEIDSMIAPLGSQESNQQPPEEEQIPSYLITINSKLQPHPKNQISDQIISSTKQNTFLDYKIITHYSHEFSEFAYSILFNFQKHNYFL
ncbi:hypothetical protein M9Y10_017458 [Tritrichomonas musculus]|uniref:Uncharacterized protein n=1 Tax=Tritrichomonas musculus TaxID=1915356 RepID=A0ABR2HTY7_9EUKA